jgi:hypothetical protein
MLLSSSLILLGCVAAVVPDAPQTLSVVEFSKAPESYRGQTLRICGEQLKDVGVDEPRWTLSVPQAFGYHPARVSVLPCRGRRVPTADPRMCILGRIAQRNGSLELPPSDEIVVKNPGNSSPWYLHAQCAAGSRVQKDNLEHVDIMRSKASPA